MAVRAEAASGAATSGVPRQFMENQTLAVRLFFRRHLTFRPILIFSLRLWYRLAGFLRDRVYERPRSFSSRDEHLRTSIPTQ
ncbi:hypothetical protein BGP80_16560 [Pseudomonas putida]|uniref:Uncharacterized protein n=1 Tax=Pseudomonas putida TaxID=303 RepID=A0A2S3WEW3_PSEPU|nr:hypothetical protein BGP80_16560 [Pseudomonas putida]